MGDAPLILIVDDDPLSRVVLHDYIENYAGYSGVSVCGSDEVEGAFDGAVFLIGEACGPVSVSFVHIAKPVRLGAVADALEGALKKQRLSIGLQNVSLGVWELDVAHNILRSAEDGTEVRLTEKEKDILVFLYEHTDQSVSRESLLCAVWGYVEDIETHTLETHIYRLRQKIEVDSANPKILLTTENGYLLVRS